jgi:hypothetical protein
MKDIIAGRPVFGGPLQAGGFRLRYGRARPSGLAAASCNTASMLALDDFITIGTQMKIERPGKACAITPCDEAEGPWVILDDGHFIRIDDPASYSKLKSRVKQVWDNGELVIGYGEFMENNKRLVPAGYSVDWWASDVLENLDTEDEVEAFTKILGESRSSWPSGAPGLRPEEVDDSDQQFLVRCAWHQQLRTKRLDWSTAQIIAKTYGTSLTSPHNPWFRDLPIEWLPPLLDLLESATLEQGQAPSLDDGIQVEPRPCARQMRLRDAVKGWQASALDELAPEGPSRF